MLESQLGEGAMGIVWRGRDLGLDLPVAVKILPPHLAARQGAVIRFLRESQVIAKLNHPNIVRILQAGSRSFGDHQLRVLVMELIEGEDLKSVLSSHEGQGIEPRFAAEVLLASARALRHAHRRGIVHRDVKPHNIMVSEDRQTIKVLDFGLAKAVELEQDDTEVAERERTLTHAGAVIGTPAYMSPEQVSSSDVDGRSDVYSLGITFFELLSGQLPFEQGGPFGILRAHAQEPISGAFLKLPELTPFFLDLIQGMCAKQPDKRLSLDAVIEALESYLLGSEVRVATTESGVSSAARTNIADPRTSFIGRDTEVRELGELIEEEGCRLVSVIGIGGVGKTRFLQEFGLQALPKVHGGVWTCDLSGARDAAGICQAVAKGLDIPLTRGEPVEQLHAALRFRGQVLVILDNFEQVTHCVEETLGVWLQETPQVRFLVSSRQRLHLNAERVFQLEPLIHARSSPDHAVQLFVDRAREARRDFALDDGNRADIEEIVTHLDGIPLAIELAAARVSLMAPHKILERLSQRFSLLRSRSKEVAPRQATLRDTLEWSWELLEPYEQEGLMQCAVFQGGFFLDAAEGVLDLSGFDDAPFEIDVIEALCDKSLLSVSEVAEARGEMRFRLLESVREFALEKSESSQADGRRELEERHANWYVDYASEWNARIPSAACLEAVTRVEFALPNLFAAQDYLQERNPHRAAEALLAADEALHVRGPWKERAPRLNAAREALANDPGCIDALIQLELASARCGVDVGDSEQLKASASRAQELASRLPGDDPDFVALRLRAAQAQLMHLDRIGEDKQALELMDAALEREGIAPTSAAETSHSLPRPLQVVVAYCVGSMANLYKNCGEYDAAIECYQQAEAIQRRVDNLPGLATVQGNKGTVFLHRGLYDQANECFTSAEKLNRQIGNRAVVALNISNRGNVLFMRQAYAEAIEVLREAEAIVRDLGNLAGIALIVGNIGAALREIGRYDESMACLTEAESIGRELGDQGRVAMNIGNRAGVLEKLERWDEALEAYREAEEISRTIGANYALSAWLHGLGGVLVELERDYEEALVYASEALRLRGEMGMEKSLLYFSSLALTAWCHYKLGDGDAAATLATQAKDLGTELNPDHSSGGWVWINEILQVK